MGPNRFGEMANENSLEDKTLYNLSMKKSLYQTQKTQMIDLYVTSLALIYDPSQSKHNMTNMTVHYNGYKRRQTTGWSHFRAD